MSQILGATEQMEDIRDGTLCRSKSPCPGPKGRDLQAMPRSSSLGLTLQIHAVRETQQAIRLRIGVIRDSLDALKNGALGLEFWTAAGVSSFEDLRSAFSARWQNLMNDVHVLRDHLRDLGAGGSAHPSLQGGAALVCAGTDQDIENLLHNAEKDGELDSSQLEQIRRTCEGAIRCWTDAVASDPSEANMKGLVSQLAVASQLGLSEDSDAIKNALATLRGSTTKITRTAEKRFRDEPSSKNYREYCHAAAVSLLVDGEGFSDMPAAVPRLRREKFYVTRAGDTLSGISKMFYSTPSYWDFIYMMNRKEVGANPDRLASGLRLRIP
jgi:hypothetical protein